MTDIYQATFHNCLEYQSMASWHAAEARYAVEHAQFQRARREQGKAAEYAKEARMRLMRLIGVE